ncbi:MAG: hypothetical protein AAB907_00925, partial [Patescibacteria group bacterium]
LDDYARVEFGFDRYYSGAFQAICSKQENVIVVSTGRLTDITTVRKNHPYIFDKSQFNAWCVINLNDNVQGMVNS